MKGISARRIVSVALVSALVLGMVAGCSGSGSDGSAESSKAKVVKIGFAAPLTGDNAIYGEGMRRAAQLAIDEANASTEVKDAGYRFELKGEDDQGDPKQAVNVANLLAGDTGVVGIVGHFNSGCSIPASAVYYRAGLPMISVSSNPQLTAQGYEVVNRIVAKDDAQGAFAAQLVAEGLGLKTVCIVDDATPYGQGLANEFEKTFPTLGGTVLSRERIQPKEVDFSAVVTKMKSKNPDAVYYAGGLNEGALLTKQAKEAGLAVPVVGGDMIYSPEYIKVAGATNAEGDFATALGLPLEQQPKGVEFEAKYQAEYDKSPEAYDSYAYDSAWIFIKSVLEAGTDRKAVAEAIRSGSFDGVTGTVAFDKNGDNKQQIISAYEVKGGAWEQYPFEPR